MSEANRRQLKIKAGTVRRLRKELAMYIEEQEKEAAKVQKLRDEGADPHDIKYAVRRPLIAMAITSHHWPGPLAARRPPRPLQENILSESTAMIPDTRGRLETAVKELQALVVSTPRQPV